VANSLCFITLAIATVDGEPRVLDIDLARSLCFDRPRDIRKIIARYKANLLKFGICATVAQIHEGAGRPAIEYWLNKQQALFITARKCFGGSRVSGMSRSVSKPLSKCSQALYRLRRR
jgi:hypothetical protein